jgi:hypothetical protein
VHRARKKMTRREIKQDPLLIWTSRVSLYLEEHLWSIIGGVAVFVLIVFGTWIYRGWDEGQVAKGMTAVAELENIATTGDDERLLMQSDAVIAAYGGQPSEIAQLYKADVLRRQGEFAAAGSLYESLDGAFDSDNEAFGFRVVKGRADALGAMGNNADAARKLMTWADENIESGLAAHALVEAAVNLERAGEWTAARDALQRVVVEYEKSQIVGDARRRLRMLEGAVAASR